jgi:putative intracellular protease/amidase
MKIAYILYDGVNTMDFDGFYEAMALLKFLKCKEDITWDICANKEFITDEKGSVKLQISHVKPDLSRYDLLYVPGGFSTRKLIYDSEFIQWLQTARDVEHKISVCSGS